MRHLILFLISLVLVSKAQATTGCEIKSLSDESVLHYYVAESCEISKFGGLWGRGDQVEHEENEARYTAEKAAEAAAQLKQAAMAKQSSKLDFGQQMLIEMGTSNSSSLSDTQIKTLAKDSVLNSISDLLLKGYTKTAYDEAVENKSHLDTLIGQTATEAMIEKARVFLISVGDLQE